MFDSALGTECSWPSLDPGDGLGFSDRNEVDDVTNKIK
jgi:hypothetical protein